MAPRSPGGCKPWAFATGRHSPWQNGHVERRIGSILRECLDHVVVLGERHLRHLLANYATYYDRMRTHLALDKDAPLHGEGVGRHTRGDSPGPEITDTSAIAAQVTPAIAEIVRRQAELGIDCIGDGEFWASSVTPG